MTAKLTTYDPELLKRAVTDHLLERLKMPDWFTPEWRAWADEWREEVPLTSEQERENSEWEQHVKAAAQKLRDLHTEYTAAIDGLAKELGVEVYLAGEDGDGAYEVDDANPPHRTSYRTKDGAPPAPPQFKTVVFRGSGVTR